jgi:hypothetical protein
MPGFLAVIAGVAIGAAVAVVFSARRELPDRDRGTSLGSSQDERELPPV